MTEQELLQKKRQLLLKRKELLESQKADIPVWKDRKGAARINSFIAGTGKGVAGLAGLPVDTATNVLNLGLAGYGTITNAIGRPDLSPNLISNPYGGSERIAKGLNRLGFETENRQPWDKISRGAYTAGLILGSSALPVKAITARAGFRPVETVLSSAAGGGTSLATDDPGLIGLSSMTPGVIGAAGSRSAQLALSKTRSGQAAKESVATFKQAGTSPTLGQATESPFFLAMEDVLSKLPGGHMPLLGKLKKQQIEVGASAGKPGSAEDAGRAIEKGIDKFKARTSIEWKKMDNKLRAELGPDATVAPANTLATLDDLAGSIAGIERSSQALVSEKLVRFRLQLKADMGENKTLSVDALRRLRSRVGELMDGSMSSEISRGELKKLYGAMSEDLKAAAISADAISGTGKAVHTWNLQNRYWRAREERIDTALNRVLGKNKLPEEIFAATSPKNVEQVNLLRQVTRSLKPDEREVVSNAIIGRLGRATPGQQTDVGDVFSTDVFLKNWNKISPAAKVQIIPNGSTRMHLDSIAKTSSRIKESGEVGREFAGRFGSLSQVVFLGMIAGGGWAGGVGGAIAVGGLTIPAIRVTSNLMVHEPFVRWVAQSTKPVNPQQYAQRLAVIYNEADEQTRLDLDDFMLSISNAIGKRQESPGSQRHEPLVPQGLAIGP